MSTSRPLILVVGMHRSGTSLLGSILQRLGVAMPGPLLPGDIHNPEGYFERGDVTALQEELLIDLHRWWPSEAGLQSLPEGWLHAPRAQRAAACLTHLLAADLPHQQGPWAIKDPRTSLLLPLWRQVAAELALPLQLLLAVRDPAEVVVSLVGRDGGPAGMTADRAQGLWLRHHQQLLADGPDLPLQVVSYGRWFSAPQPQIEALARFCGLDPDAPATAEPLRQALACIQPRHRRSQANADRIPLQRGVRRWQQQLERAACSGGSEALRGWALRQRAPPAAPPVAQHPWVPALRALDTPYPFAGLRHWQQHGIPAISLQHLAALRLPGLPGNDPSSSAGPPLPPQLTLELVGADPHHWNTHLWIHQLPLAAGTTLLPPGDQPAAALHLQPLELTAANPGRLQQLSQWPRVFDPCPDQVRLLRLLGVNAELLSPRQPEPEAASHAGWLQRAGDGAAAAQQLGLPAPEALPPLGGRWLCLGTSTQPGWLEPSTGLLHLPGFPPAPALSPDQARLLASWIASCLDQGLPLVRLNPEPGELPLWSCLGVPCVHDPITPEELLQELAWRQAGCPAPAAVHTPEPTAELLWSLDSGIQPAAAICISSYNYADRLTCALDSCRHQSLEALELVIVDDASSDASPEVAQHWLEQHGQRFCRVQLLQHTSNAGLAAARNSAFRPARAPWCWVLDADNQIDPQAIAHCLHLAHGSSPETAVVHPLIRIRDDAGQLHGLVGGGHAWQQEQLRAGNVVDAMALVRRSAWEAVGGYSHIPGGWEDFDFWCKLIETVHHGVLCPEVLATYQRHGESMLQSHTNHQQRQLSRLLQHRHPWLQLALAQSDC